MNLLSVLTAIIASGTALWIAYKVYPLQKAEDRRIKLAEEKATVYRGFFDVADDYHETSKAHFTSGRIDDFTAHFAALNKAQRALLLYAPPNVVQSCNAYADSLRIYRYAVRKEIEGKSFPRNAKEASRGAAYHEVEARRRKALVSVRVDLLGCDPDEALKAVQGIAEQDENGQDSQ